MIKIYNKFLNIHCDVHYSSAKFEIQIQIVYGETKNTNCIIGVK